MPRLTVTAKRLNKRRTVPAAFPDAANIAGEVFLGDVFNAEEVATVPNPALGKWYVDRDGYYYWGGGVKENFALGSPPISAERGESRVGIPAIVWRDNFIGLSEDLKTQTGSFVKVAIIDTGVEITHPALSANIDSPRDFTQNTGPMTDDDGHGTAIAGIIAASSLDAGGFKGIAPGCKIIPIKVMKNTFDKEQLTKNILNAIQYAIDSKADIINISQDLGRNINEDLKSVMKMAASRGIVLIASAGDIDELTETGVTYPGSDPNFISIGASNELFIQSILDKRPARLDFLGGFKMFPTLSPKPEKYISVIGSSFCAAFMSGVCTLIISKLKSEGKSAGQFPRQIFVNQLSAITSTEGDLHKENFFSFIKI